MAPRHWVSGLFPKARCLCHGSWVVQICDAFDKAAGFGSADVGLGLGLFTVHEACCLRHNFVNFGKFLIGRSLPSECPQTLLHLCFVRHGAALELLRGCFLVQVDVPGKPWRSTGVPGSECGLPSKFRYFLARERDLSVAVQDAQLVNDFILEHNPGQMLGHRWHPWGLTLNLRQSMFRLPEDCVNKAPHHLATKALASRPL